MPIHSFNNTLIRPEHYPLRDEKVALESIEGYPIFTREDETVKQQIYTRNIETLDFSICHRFYSTIVNRCCCLEIIDHLTIK